MTTEITPASTAPFHRRTVIAAIAGNLVENYDWLGFGLFAPLFAGQFFPSSNPVDSLLNTFAVYAAGMFFRPLGGILLGRFADRRGRRPALVLAIVLMGGGSTLIGISPTYHQIGVLAPLLLVIGRAAQGMSAGGEWTASVTYLMELAPRNRKCFYGSLFAVSAVSGALIASLLGGGLTGVLGGNALSTWGWRVPFLFGGVLGLMILLLRRRLAESAVFQRTVRTQTTRGSLGLLFSRYWRSLVLAGVFVAGVTVVSSTWTTVLPAMGERGAAPGTMFWVVLVVTGASAVVQVPMGLLADRIGVQPILAVAAIGFAIAGPFAFLGLGSGFGSLVFGYGTGIAYLVLLTSVMPKVMAALFPPDVRAIGIGLPYGVTTAIAGGVSPWLATYLVSHRAGGAFAAIAVVSVLLAWLAAALAAHRNRRVPADRAESGTEPGDGTELAA